MTAVNPIAQLIADDGASNVDFLQLGAGAVERTVEDKLQDVVSVKDFGAKGNGMWDDTAAFNAALAASSVVKVPAGVYLLSSPITAGAVSLIGDASGGSVLRVNHQSSHGLRFVALSQSASITVANLRLEAANANGPCPLAIDIEYPSASSRGTGRLLLDNIQIVSGTSGSPYPNTWARGLKIKNAWYPVINNISGNSYFNAGDTGATGFCEIVGGSYACIAPKFNNIEWYNGATGILCSAYVEGMMLTNTEFVAVTRGLHVPASTPVGGVAGLFRGMAFWVSDIHIAAHTACVSLDTVQNVTFADCNMQRWADLSATNWTSYVFNETLYPSVVGGTITGNENSGGVTTVGIAATGNLSAHGIISGIHFENLDTQFSLNASTSRWTIRGNTSVGLPATVDSFTVLGSNHDIEWNRSTDGWIQRRNAGLTFGSQVYQAATEAAVNNAAGVTYTAAQMLSPFLTRSGASGAVSDTTPTAAQLVAAVPGAAVNTMHQFVLVNLGGGTLTLLAGSGVTLTGTTTVTNAWARTYFIRFTNVTPGAEAVQIYGAFQAQTT